MRKFSLLLLIIIGFQVFMVNTLANDDLPVIVLTGSEDDHHRMNEAIHGAHALAEVGAGYEAARVLAAIALQVRDSDLGNEAVHLLNEWGLTVNMVRQGSAKDVIVKIANAMRDRRHSGAALQHVRNLIELEFYTDAARLLRQGTVETNRNVIERTWGEILHRYRLPIELLRDDAKDADNELANALQTAHQQNQLRVQIRFLRVVDPEASEMAEMLLQRIEPHKRDEDDEEHRRPFERWVEHNDDESEEDERGPSIEELVLRVVHQAINLANRSKPSSRLLATLVTKAAPDSESADKARSLIKMLASPVTNTLDRTFVVEDDPGAGFFGAKRVRKYHLELSDRAIEQLHEEPKHYVRATFREGDDVYKDVGVRLKGGYGSFRMLDSDSKAAFTIKFNQFVKDQRFHGLRRIILNNAVQDPSYICEYIGYSLFRDAGVPAPRIGYAMLTINEESYGLYEQVEAISKDFLKRWYSKTGGNLYEGPGDVMQWDELDLDSNQEREDRSDLRHLAEAIEEANDDDPWELLADFVDVDNFTRFIALEQLINHWDGYTQTNNYRMYNNPETMKFEFFPHGADQLFEDLGGNIFREQGGILSRALVQTDSGKRRYGRMMHQLLEQVWDESTIKNRIAETYRLIHPYVAAESGKGRRVEEFEEAVRRMLRFVGARRYVVLSQLQATEQDHSWRERQHFGFNSFLHASHHDW
ncbi:TPA: hypothetical protein EYN65_07950 [Candidatus Poribacteria bacterium]|nr:hypothetical protein [Candidatus Poribacteria bacterium]